MVGQMHGRSRSMAAVPRPGIPVLIVRGAYEPDKERKATMRSCRLSTRAEQFLATPYDRAISPARQSMHQILPICTTSLKHAYAPHRLQMVQTMAAPLSSTSLGCGGQCGGRSSNMSSRIRTIVGSRSVTARRINGIPSTRRTACARAAGRADTVRFPRHGPDPWTN